MNLPSLFLSHGAPTAALDKNLLAAQWRALGAAIEPLQPKAVLAISAHWSEPSLKIATRTPQVAWHDFGNFGAELFALRYAPPGAPEVAAEVMSLLHAAGYETAADPRRPLDHGVWVPLRSMFPAAQIPVTQLSLREDWSRAEQFKLGQALRPLVSQGVLIMATGSLTHNLREVVFSNEHAPVLPHVEAFRRWMRERMAAGDLEAMVDYRARAPQAERIQPTDEHLLPLYVAMGAADDWTRCTPVVKGITYAALAMDGFAFGSGSAGMRVDASSLVTAG